MSCFFPRFLLRLFTDESSSLHELSEDSPSPAWYDCCRAEPAMVTRVTVKGARGLEKQDTFGSKEGAQRGGK